MKSMKLPCGQLNQATLPCRVARALEQGGTITRLPFFTSGVPLASTGGLIGERAAAVLDHHRVAGRARRRRASREGHPDDLVAFVHPDRGTEPMVRRKRERDRWRR